MSRQYNSILLVMKIIICEFNLYIHIYFPKYVTKNDKYVRIDIPKFGRKKIAI